MAISCSSAPSGRTSALAILEGDTGANSEDVETGGASGTLYPQLCRSSAAAASCDGALGVGKEASTAAAGNRQGLCLGEATPLGEAAARVGLFLGDELAAGVSVPSAAFLSSILRILRFLGERLSKALEMASTHLGRPRSCKASGATPGSSSDVPLR